MMDIKLVPKKVFRVDDNRIGVVITDENGYHLTTLIGYDHNGILDIPEYTDLPPHIFIQEHIEAMVDFHNEIYEDPYYLYKNYLS